MHPDLSSHLHTPECNIIIEALKKCHDESPWQKFFGACNDIDRALNKCLITERENRRKSNQTKNKQKSE